MINFYGIHPANWKITKAICQLHTHKTDKRQEDLASRKLASYRPLSLTSCHRKLLEKVVADNFSSGAEPNINKKIKCFKRQEHNSLLKLSETIKFCFLNANGCPTTGIFLDVKSSTMGFPLS